MLPTDWPIDWLTSGCAVPELLQLHQRGVGKLVQLQVIWRQEERRHAVHRYLHGRQSMDRVTASALTCDCQGPPTTHCVVDDFQRLRFHVKPLVGALIQRVGLEEERQQRRPCAQGCLPGGEQDRRRPVSGQAGHLEQAELCCDPAGETKRRARKVRRWRPPSQQ